MSSGCKSSVACVEAHAPVRATYVNLYKWPESDAEFVKSVACRARSDHAAGSSRWTSAPVVDSYSCRQMYLRSYTFSKKESLPEKTKRCLGKVKETATVLPFLSKIRSADSYSGSFRSNAGTDRNINNAAGATSSCRKTKTKSNKSRGTTTTARKLREFSCSALMRSIFRRLLACTSSVDVVVDRGGHNYC